MPRGLVYEGETWQPLTYSLSDGPVNSIQTSDTNPKVGFDSTGIFITDANGNKLVQLTSSGVELPASSDGNSSVPPEVVEWLVSAIRQSYVNGYLQEGGVPNTYGGIKLAAESNAEPTFNGHNELHLDAGGNNVLARAWATIAGTGGFSTLAGGFGGVVDILDGDGYSSFVHNGNTATAPARPKPLKLRVGGSVIHFPTSQTGTLLTITHGLGRTPTQILATVGSAGNVPAFAYVSQFPTSTTFTMQAWCPSSITGDLAVFWVVLG